MKRGIAVLALLASCGSAAFAEETPAQDTLTALAAKYETDKGLGTHGFTEFYELFFRPIKDTARHVCEIGVLEGASMKMWNDYFPNATVYGLDIEDTTRFETARVKTFVADQGKRRELGRFTAKYPVAFDFVLDDGGHRMNQQQVSLAYFFPKIKSGGYYVLEDVHCSLPRHRPGYGADEDEGNTSLTMIERFQRTGKIESPYMTPQEAEYLTAQIESCTLHSRNGGESITCVFKKK